MGDAELRNIEYNGRIMLWVIIGWTSVSVHTIMSFIVAKLIDDEYDLDIAELGINMFGDEVLKEKIDSAKKKPEARTPDAGNERTTDGVTEAGGSAGGSVELN